MQYVTSDNGLDFGGDKAHVTEGYKVRVPVRDGELHCLSTLIHSTITGFFLRFNRPLSR